MNKSILALAVATTLAAPFVVQADTILYGSARVSVDYLDEKITAFERFNGIPAPESNWNVVNNDSRLGVLGSEELGGGLSAVYQYEFGVDVTEGGNFESNRPKFVGLKGGFGTLTIGTQETPYYHVAGIVDTFNTTKSFGAPAWLGGSFNGFFDTQLGIAEGRSTESLTRLANSIYYTTPEFSGFSAEAMLVLNGAFNSPAHSDGVDIWNLAAKYSNGPFFAGVSYIKSDGDSNTVLLDGDTLDLDMDQWVVGLGYNAGPFSVGLIYEAGYLNENGLLGSWTTTNNGQVRQPYHPYLNSDKPQNWYLTASYSFGNNTLRAAYGQMDTGLNKFAATFNRGGPVDVINLDNKIDNYLVGYQYNFSKRTLVWAEYIGRGADTNFYGDSNAFSIGTRVDF
ncbi:MAG TPA: porin [Candidatus Competibacteraceae bacterium]|nr:porin [Candidatus Competibacteraceae bacterium]